VGGQRQFADLHRKPRRSKTQVVQRLAESNYQALHGRSHGVAHLERRRSSLRDGRAATVRFAANYFELARWKNGTGYGAAIVNLARDA